MNNHNCGGGGGANWKHSISTSIIFPQGSMYLVHSIQTSPYILGLNRGLNENPANPLILHIHA